jgi:hypothetical protein
MGLVFAKVSLLIGLLRTQQIVILLGSISESYWQRTQGQYCDKSRLLTSNSARVYAQGICGRHYFCRRA